MTRNQLMSDVFSSYGYYFDTVGWMTRNEMNLACKNIGSPQRFLPRAGSGVVRIDPLHFLAGCPTRRLN